MPEQTVIFVDGETAYLFMDEEVYQCRTEDIQYFPERAYKTLPLISFVRIGNASIGLPSHTLGEQRHCASDVAHEGRSSVVRSEATFHDHCPAVQRFSRDELIDTPLNRWDIRASGRFAEFGCDTGRLDEPGGICNKKAAGKTDEDGEQDTESVSTTDRVLEEADESGTNSRASLNHLPILAHNGPSTPAFSSCTRNILLNMDQRSRVAVLVDKAVELFGPIPRDVFEAILYPTEANQRLALALHDCSIQQIINVMEKLNRESRCDLSQEIHRVVLFTGCPNDITEYVQWRLGFKSTAI
ncbi:hypothetical protein PM082_017188 [Marasmius tenuissimus]|nr:hypothetical protein PM082_017188 [Marasmius tenuissimus]